jgi:hypothetical protein
MKKIKILYLLALLLFCSLISCNTVPAWEKGNLSRPIMQFDSNPIEKGIKDHHLEYREGAAGGNGSQSGGCGCG